MDRVWLEPLSRIYGGAVVLREHMYRQGLLRSTRLSVPVVSVGNLSMGGTGKTPFVDHLLGWAKKQNLSAGLVSRGYGGEHEGVHRVLAGESGAVAGDEPALLARRHPHVPIYVSSDKASAGQALLREQTVDFVVIDDGFQTRRLHRDLDIVLIDALEPVEMYRLLPRGRLREPLSALERADFVVVTRTNLVSGEKLEELFGMISKGVKLRSPPILSEARVPSLRSWVTGSVANPPSSFLLVSGVGRPESFEQLMREMKVPFGAHEIYRDHYHYREQDAQHLVKRLQETSASAILTTEKDAVKLERFEELKSSLWVADLELSLPESSRVLYEAVARLAHR